jgi:transcriptional regulator with XRE-family HTH domain
MKVTKSHQNNNVEHPMEVTVKSEQVIDKHLGAKIKELRSHLGLSQSELAELIGVTYQQTHKYEKGTNRISASKLFTLAKSLNIPINFFFEEISVEESMRNTNNPPPQHRLCMEVSRRFRNIKNPRHQEAVYYLVRMLSE